MALAFTFTASGRTGRIKWTVFPASRSVQLLPVTRTHTSGALLSMEPAGIILTFTSKHGTECLVVLSSTARLRAITMSTSDTSSSTTGITYVDMIQDPDALLANANKQTADELVSQAATGGPPTAINGLINGTNTYNDTLGSRFETVFEAGTRYRIRLVNAAADNHFRFMIDNHTLEVIANDFVPIIPYNTTDLSIGMGQRYDIIVTAKDISSGDFWLRAIPQESCSESDATDNVKGIVRYDNSSTADPTTSAYDYTDSCSDESPSNLVPYVAIDATDDFAAGDDQEVGVEVTDNALLWTTNGTSMRTAWEYPTLMQVADGNSTWARKQQVIQFDQVDEWVYIVVHSPFAQDHPMHLHGHDFWVLGSGYGNFDSTQTNALQLVNAPRRDVAMMPASGYLVIAFKTNNPGVRYPLPFGLELSFADVCFRLGLCTATSRGTRLKVSRCRCSSVLRRSRSIRTSSTARVRIGRAMLLPKTSLNTILVCKGLSGILHSTVHKS